MVPFGVTLGFRISIKTRELPRWCPCSGWYNGITWRSQCRGFGGSRRGGFRVMLSLELWVLVYRVAVRERGRRWRVGGTVG